MSNYKPPDNIAESHSVIYLYKDQDKEYEDEYVVNYKTKQNPKTVLVDLNRRVKAGVIGFIKIKSTTKIK